MCLWCALAFLGVNLQGNQGGAVLSHWGYLTERDIYAGKAWGLITLAFVHKEPLHLLFNLYWFWIIGGAFERTLGSVALLIFILTSAFISSGIQLGTEGIGIGLSGVGYALFGFAWISRTRYPEFARIMNDRTVRVFLIWFVICVFTTYAHIMNIANVAHLTGLLFGMALAEMVVKPRFRILLSFAVVALAAASIVPLYWNPLSERWAADKAVEARQQGDYDRAVALYLRSLKLGAEPKWVWSSLAEVYALKRDPANFQEAVNKVKVLDPEAAQELVKGFHQP